VQNNWCRIVILHPGRPAHQPLNALRTERSTGPSTRGCCKK
jgi:hypothetical protein